MKPRTKKLVSSALTGALLTMAFGLAAAVVLMLQEFPPIPATGLSPNCAQLDPDNTTIPFNSSGRILFSCGGSSAFRALGGTIATPTFALSGDYVDLWLVDSTEPTNKASCPDFTSKIPLTSGDTMTFGATRPWNYCADFGPVGETGLPAFTVTWES